MNIFFLEMIKCPTLIQIEIDVSMMKNDIFILKFATKTVNFGDNKGRIKKTAEGSLETASFFGKIS